MHKTLNIAYLIRLMAASFLIKLKNAQMEIIFFVSVKIIKLLSYKENLFAYLCILKVIMNVILIVRRIVINFKKNFCVKIVLLKFE